MYVTIAIDFMLPFILRLFYNASQMVIVRVLDGAVKISPHWCYSYDITTATRTQMSFDWKILFRKRETLDGDERVRCEETDRCRYLIILRAGSLLIGLPGRDVRVGTLNSLTYLQLLYLHTYRYHTIKQTQQGGGMHTEMYVITRTHTHTHKQGDCKQINRKLTVGEIQLETLVL